MLQDGAAVGTPTALLCQCLHIESTQSVARLVLYHDFQFLDLLDVSVTESLEDSSVATGKRSVLVLHPQMDHEEVRCPKVSICFLVESPCFVVELVTNEQGRFGGKVGAEELYVEQVDEFSIAVVVIVDKAQFIYPVAWIPIKCQKHAWRLCCCL